MTISDGAHSQSSPVAPALLQALSGQRPTRTPVWFMRQAGRSLPEYRALRSAVDLPMLEVCLSPELAAEATLQPVRRHGVDAAVFFSDIMIPLRLAGVGVEIQPNVGPVLDRPVRTAADVDALVAHRFGEGSWTDSRGRTHTAASGVEAVAQGVRLVVEELGSPSRPGVPTGDVRADAGLAQSRGQAAWTPVIGFGGAPFTLAAYLVEGRPSRDHLAARTLMHSQPEIWDRLMRWCAQVTADFMRTQVEAGASAAQLFDSWAGSLSPADYRKYVAPYSALVLEQLRDVVSGTTGASVQLIHFGTGTARILGEMHDAGAQAVGVDDKTDLAWAIEALSQSAGGLCPVQGNLDPALLGAPTAVLDRAIEDCLAAGRRAPGHVVNLGHGVPPGTNPQVLTRIVARVHGDAAWEQTATQAWEPVAAVETMGAVA